MLNIHTLAVSVYQVFVTNCGKDYENNIRYIVYVCMFSTFPFKQYVTQYES